MAHVERELGQIHLHIGPVLVPPQECGDGEAVPEILHARPVPVLVANADDVEELRERSTETDAVYAWPRAWQMSGALGSAVEAGALPGVEVAPEFRAHAGRQRHPAGFIELRLPNEENASARIDVAEREPLELTSAKPGRVKQKDRKTQDHRPQWLACRGH